jgi:hypothetical protein
MEAGERFNFREAAARLPSSITWMNTLMASNRSMNHTPTWRQVRESSCRPFITTIIPESERMSAGA